MTALELGEYSATELNKLKAKAGELRSLKVRGKRWFEVPDAAAHFI